MIFFLTGTLEDQETPRGTPFCSFFLTGTPGPPGGRLGIRFLITFSYRDSLGPVGSPGDLLFGHFFLQGLPRTRGLPEEPLFVHFFLQGPQAPLGSPGDRLGIRFLIIFSYRDPLGPVGLPGDHSS